jgi:hypothetical protein
MYYCKCVRSLLARGDLIRRYVSFRDEAEVGRAAESAASVEIDPEAT